MAQKFEAPKLISLHALRKIYEPRDAKGKGDFKAVGGRLFDLELPQVVRNQRGKKYKQTFAWFWNYDFDTLVLMVLYIYIYYVYLLIYNYIYLCIYKNTSPSGLFWNFSPKAVDVGGSFKPLMVESRRLHQLIW